MRLQTTVRITAEQVRPFIQSAMRASGHTTAWSFFVPDKAPVNRLQSRFKLAYLSRKGIWLDD
jgi:hypothetical protein